MRQTDLPGLTEHIPAVPKQSLVAVVFLPFNYIEDWIDLGFNRRHTDVVESWD